MTQAHSLLLKDHSFTNLSTISEEHLSINTRSHLKALRIRTHELIDFMDGQGQFLHTRCTQTLPYSFEVIRLSKQERPLPILHLFISPPRKDSLSQALSQATELGANKFTFIKSDHNDLSSKEFPKTLERSRRVIESCVEQCRSPYLPIINEEFLEIKKIPDHEIVFFADENLSQKNLIGLENPQSTFETLKSMSSSSKPINSWALLIGPEGGWSESERQHLSQRPNTIPLGLGSQILKVPTACVCGLNLLQYYRYQLTAGL